MARSWAIPLPVALAIAGGLAGGAAALAFGFTPEWDLLNYHLYNPHALLHGRWAIDVAPAQMQSYLNPLLYLPQYLLFRYVSPTALTVTLGVVQGAQWALLYKLTLCLDMPRRLSPVWPAIVALLGLGGPVFLSELGVSQGDTVLSALVLGALLLTMPQPSRAARWPPLRRALAAGLLIGLATALKLVFGLYAVALALAVLAASPQGRRWKCAAALTGGGIVGLLLAGGWWFGWLWAEYGNPLFPYFNNLFGSSWVGEASLRDLRFMPRSVVDWLAYPVVWLLDPHRVWEWPFRDLRVVLLIPAVAGVVVLLRRRLSPNVLFACVFVLASYVLWLAMFSIYRYLAVVEMLAAPLLFALIAQAGARRRVLLAVLTLLVASQAAVRFHRHAPLPELRAGHASALAALPRDAMVIVDGYEPVGFAALWLDDGIPLVRVRANFMAAPVPEWKLQRLAEERVRNHRGPVYLLLSPEDMKHPFLANDLERLGFSWSGPEHCVPLFGDGDLERRLRLKLCALQRERGGFPSAQTIDSP